MRPKNAGPYKVTSHKDGSNHEHVRDLVHDNCLVFDCKDLQVCVATPEEAFAAACKDDQQHQIEAVIAFRGEHLHRKRMTFLVRFGDGDELWMEWSTDITNTKPFEDYCMSSRYKMLQLLVLSVEQVKKVQRSQQRELMPVSVVVRSIAGVGASSTDTMRVQATAEYKGTTVRLGMRYVDMFKMLREVCKYRTDAGINMRVVEIMDVSSRDAVIAIMCAKRVEAGDPDEYTEADLDRESEGTIIEALLYPLKPTTALQYQQQLAHVRMRQPASTLLTKFDQSVLPAMMEHAVEFHAMWSLLRFDSDAYDSRDKLPDRDKVQYYVKCRVVRTEPHNPRKCVLVQDVFKSSTVHDVFYMNYFGDIRSLEETEVELTDKLCGEYGLCV